MRIVQIIDSLEVGGAERMAVNYANALAERTDFSGLIATRKEGLLLSQINKDVNYLFLNKKKRIDLCSVFLMRGYIKKNKIEIIHAHSSSFFIAFLVKLTFPKVKIIWHDHYGISQDLKSRKSLSLKYCSFFFEGIISVNSALKEWAGIYLLCNNIIYLPNFVENDFTSNENVFLEGFNGKRIICFANLRPQKNHELLINAANLIKNKFPDWTFHLFGKDFEDSYSEHLRRKINELNLQEIVYFYGVIKNVRDALKQCQIAVLPSHSEGLPLAILEYGMCQLPVIASDVGEVSSIITSIDEGVIVEPNNLKEFVSAIEKLILSQKNRDEMGLGLYNKIYLNFSESMTVKHYFLWLESFTRKIKK